MVQIFFERPPAGCRQAILGLRHAPVERFGAGDVARIFQLSRVDAQIAVGGAQQCLSSLNVSESFTASALTIASRVRS